MGRFDRYMKCLELEINEKVSKKECNTALKNKNILIGAEFEMIIPDMVVDDDNEENYKKALEDWEQYRKDIADWEEEVSNYNDETEEMKELLSSLEDAYDGAEPYSDEDDDSYSFDDDWIKARHWESWVKDFNNEDLGDIVWKKGVKAEKSDINTLQDLQDTVSDMGQAKDSLETDITYREDEGRYEQIEEPYLLSYHYSDYVNYMTDLYNDTGGYGEDIKASVERGEYMAGEELPPRPVDYSDEMGSADFELSINLDDAPFDKYEIGEYGEVDQKVGSDVWAIENDDSLGANGVEIKSPPQPLPDFLEDMSAMFDWMKDNGYKTNSKTGFHVHMSIKNPTKKFDSLKLMLFTDEGYIFDKFSDRMNNQYVNSIKKKLKSDGNLSASDKKKIFDERKILTHILSANHFDAVNVVSVTDNHVEFRYMGGDYSRKEKDVVSTICNYAHTMALAADPDYKRKEYILKLQRIFNKMELFSSKRKVELIDTAIKKLEYHDNQEDNIKIFNKMKKMYQKIISSLKSVYKLTSQEDYQLRSNISYKNNIDDEFYNDYHTFFKKSGTSPKGVKDLDYNLSPQSFVGKKKK